ncbi:hypothetical protein I6F37_40105, partial [Bradyrhizobium sp. NBAIM08]
MTLEVGMSDRWRRWTPTVGVLLAVLAVGSPASATAAERPRASASAWGLNTWGQLGDGTTRDRHEPIRIDGLSRVTE